MKIIEIRLSCLLSIIMVMVALRGYCASSENVTMTVGETKTLYLPTSVTSKSLTSVNFYSTSIQYVQVTSHTMYSVTVKAIKAFSSPVIVRCDYYYYLNGYQAIGAYDFYITVNAKQPQSVSIPSSLSLNVGETATLTPTVTPSDAQTTFTWSTSNVNVAGVTQAGLVTAYGPGTAYITVRTANGKSATCTVTVDSPYDFISNGIYYKITGTNTVAVTYRSKEYYNGYTGNVSIPGSVVHNNKTYNVTAIRDYAMFNCPGLTAISLPSTIETIGEYAFYECRGLSAVVIPNSVRTIGKSAFSTCTGLRNLTIGSGVISIGAGAFNYSPSISTVVCYAVSPPAIVYSSFNCYSVATLYVPASSVSTYKNTSYWLSFKAILPISVPGDANGDGIVNISDATMLVSILANGGTPPAGADVNGDGQFSISDITQLISQILNQ